MFTPGPEWVCLWYKPQFIRWWLHTCCFLVTSDPTGQRREISQRCNTSTSFTKIGGWVKKRDPNCCRTRYRLRSQTLRGLGCPVGAHVPTAGRGTTASPKPQQPAADLASRGSGQIRGLWDTRRSSGNVTR